MNVNADALSRNPIDDNKEKSKYLQVDDNDTFMKRGLQSHKITSAIDRAKNTTFKYVTKS